MAARRPLLFHPRALVAAVIAFAGLALVLAIHHQSSPPGAPSEPRLLVPLFTFQALEPNPVAIPPRTVRRPCPVASHGCAAIPCIQFVAASAVRPAECNPFRSAKPHLYRIGNALP